MRRALSLLAMSVFVGTPVKLFAEEERLPSEFRFVGNYQLDKRVKIRDGAPLSVVTKPFVCRVYTDGITVRIYGEGESDGHTAFAIYRNDGVVLRTGRNETETVPGIQAQTKVGNVMRHLTLTQQRLVLSKFPALSDLVEITYAKRRVIIRRNERKLN